MASGRVSPEDTPLNLAPEQTTSYQPLHWEKGHFKENKGRPHVMRYWPLEIAGMAGALAMMGVTVFLLLWFDGEDYEEWTRRVPPSIKFSAVIATLATAARSCMLFGIAEIIGQQKWVWFTRRTRPLYHLYQFDEASRGIIGSLEILPMLFRNIRSRLTMYVLAAVTIVLVASAFGPSTQQAVGLRPCHKVSPDTRARIPVANFATGDYYRDPRGGVADVEATVDMKGIIVEALTNPQGLDTSVKPINCTTGRCSFPDYGTGTTHASIGLCSRCYDRTREAMRGQNGLVTLPIPGGLIPNLQIKTSAPYEPFLQAGFLPNHSTDPELRDTALGSVHMLTGTSPSTAPGVVAIACTLYPCLKTYHGRVYSGRLTETLITTIATVKQMSTADTGNYTAIRLPCVIDTDPLHEAAKTYRENNISEIARDRPDRTWGRFVLPGQRTETAVPNACLYKLDYQYGKALTKFFSSLLNGTCTYHVEQGDDVQCNDKWWLSQMYFGGAASFFSLNNVFGNMSAVVTNRLRTTGWGPNQHRPPGKQAGTLEWRGNGYGVNGTVELSKTCIYFDWGWIIPPVIMLLTSTALLVWSVTKNYTEQRIPLWKSDPLPLMFFGFGKKGVTGRDVPNDVSISAMHHKSKGIHVRCQIDDDDEGPGLVKGLGLRRRNDGREAYRMDAMLLAEEP
ncbi:hypothetical protein B0T16DRAFT_443671 [Cercophora newfieldiana]|uniref:Uncharacterized protein n=1 Tax=Cercophora newfieldiana TaxID=92897 RepID=A0AA39YI91_9PEZI|nr:hypothetical protein B0T16DRAFT_443671 [Cercophora newfieldiana]